MDRVLRWFGLDPFTQVDRIAGVRWASDAAVPAAVVWSVVVLGLLLACASFLPVVRMRLRVRVMTFLFRLGMVGLFLLALLQAHVKLDLLRARAQSWLLLVDDSASMRTRDVRDGSRFRAAAADADAVRRAAGQRVECATATLSGMALGEDAGEQTPTHIQSAVLRELADRPSLQRLVLLTDGRDLDRQDVAQTGEALKSRNVALDIVLYGTEKPSQVTLLAAKPERSVIRLGESLYIRGMIRDPSDEAALDLTLSEDGRVVKRVTVPREQFPWFEVAYTPDKTNLHRYVLSAPVRQETRGTNAVAFYADVRDEKINVLMIEGVPGFEFKLMRFAIATDPLVHLVTVCYLPGGGPYVQGGALHANAEEGLIQNAPELFKYDLVILRDVPRELFRPNGDQTENAMRLLVEFVQKRGGGLMVNGGGAVYRAGGYQGSPLAAILPFDLTDAFSKEAQFSGRFRAEVVNRQYQHPLLRLLPDAAENERRWERELPQLDGCNNVGRFKPMARPLLTRTAKIRAPTGVTNDVVVPILAYQDFGGGKILASSVDTFWRWQLQPDFDPTPLETLLGNVVRYMAPEPGMRAETVNVVVSDPTPALGDPVTLRTLLRNRSYEPVRMADLKVLVTRPDGSGLTLYPRDLPERPGLYEYRVQADQPGDWTATAWLGKGKCTTKFVVREPDDEFADLSVNRPDMVRLAAAAGGQVVEDPAAWMKDVDRRPVVDPAVRDLEVWNSPAILVLFILLVCADCYVRKRQGLA